MSYSTVAQWAEADCTDLKHQLQSLGYTLPFDANSAPLVAVLFRDVVKSARYGKTAQKLLDERNGTIASLENEVNKAKSTQNDQLTGPSLLTLRCRFFRLLRLAGSAIYIASRTVENPSKEVTKWTSASTGLLSALLSYEKQLSLEQDIPKADETEAAGAPEHTNSQHYTNDSAKYPSFLVEFHELWKTIEERDLAREEVKEREEQLTHILTGNKEQSPSVQPRHVKNELEEELLLNVQTLKNRLENIFEGLPPAEEHMAGSILKQLESIKLEAVSLKQANKAAESELKYVEKKFASHLKECQKATRGGTGNDRPVRPINDENSIKCDGENKINGLESENQWREERRRLQVVLDSKNMDLSILQTQIAKLNTELHETSKNWHSSSEALRTVSEELSAVQKRCDLFESEFRNLDMKRIEDEEYIKRLNMDLDELRDVKRRYDETTERLEDVQIRYVALDQQLVAIKEELSCKALQYECLLKSKTSLDAENTRLKADVEDGAATANQLNQHCRESRSELQKVKLELVRLKEELGNESKAIENEADRNRKLKQQVERLEESELAILREKEEALKNREMYRASLKDARRRMESLEGEIEELKKRNDFILNQLMNNNDPDGGIVGDGNTMAQSPSIPQTILQALACQKATRTDECEAAHELDNRNLRIENALMREKCENLLSMLRKTAEARKIAQSEINRLTIRVTTLEAQLASVHDQLELGRFTSNVIRRGNNEIGDLEKNTDPILSQATTSRFGSSQPVTIQSASDAPHSMSVSPSTHPKTIQSASEYPETSVTGPGLRRFDQSKDTTPGWRAEYALEEQMMQHQQQQQNQREGDSASLGDPFTTRPVMQQFRSNTQPISQAFNCHNLRAHLSPVDSLLPTRFSYDPTPVPNKETQKDIGSHYINESQHVINVSSEEANSWQLSDEENRSNSLRSNNSNNNNGSSKDSGLFNRSLLDHSNYREVQVPLDSNYTTLTNDTMKEYLVPRLTSQGVGSGNRSSFRERALNKLRLQRDLLAKDEDLMAKKAPRSDVVRLNSPPADTVRLNTVHSDMTSLPSGSPAAGATEDDYQVEIDSPPASLSGTSSLSSSRYSEYISRHSQQAGLSLSPEGNQRDTSVFSYTNEMSTPGTNEQLGEPLSGPRGYCVEHIEDISEGETPRCRDSEHFSERRDFGEENGESLPTSFGLPGSLGLPTSYGLLSSSKTLRGPMLSNRTIGGSFGLSRSSEDSSSMWMISQTSTAKVTSRATSLEYSESEAPTTNSRNVNY